MTFLALNIQKSSLIEQKSDLEYQEMVYTNEYDYVTSRLADLTSDSSVDLSNNREAAKLQALQQFYDSKKNSIESQLEVINGQIEGFQKAVSTNIKSECKLTISV